MDKQDQELIRAARATRKRAYAPYSQYRVGAALRGASGNIYTGANVENASYGLTICAERSAIVKAISEGERKFTAVAVASSTGATPCGACRQTLAEFGDMRVIVVDGRGRVAEFVVSELLAHGFGASKLKSGK